MTSDSRPPKPATPPNRLDPATLWAGATLALAVLAVVFVRARLLQMPFERDEGEFAYVGQLMLDGVPPYQLAYHVKLPGTYGVYALMMAIFGQSVAAIHFGFLLVNLAAVALVFLVARRLLDLRGAMIAAASYALLSTTPVLLGLAAHATHLVAAAALGGLLLLLRARESGTRAAFLWSGVLFGIAFLCKQPGLFFGLFGAAILLRDAAHLRPPAWPQFWRRFALFAFGLALPCVLTALLLLRAGAFERFWFWTVSYARFQAGLTPPETAYYQLKNFLGKVEPLWPFWVFATVGLGAVLFSKEHKDRNFLILVLLACSFLAFAMRLYFHPHYFIVMLPALALLIALAANTVEQRIIKPNSTPLARLVAVALFSLACVFHLFQNRAIWFALTPDAACREIYRGNPFVESVEIGRYLKEHSPPEARIAVLGTEPQIYFYAHRHSATGYIGVHDLVEPNPYSSLMQRALIDEVQAAKPEYFLFINLPPSWLVWPGADSTIFDWCKQYTHNFYDPAGMTYIYPSRTEYDWSNKGVKKDAGTSWLIYIYKRKPSPPSAPQK